MKTTMKALVYEGPGKIELKEVPKPEIIEPGDAVVKILKTTICGTDLGILKGKNPEIVPGTILGHEGVGEIDDIGTAVRDFKKGDRVIISCITSDGVCENCKKQLFSHCKDGGWLLGHLINGTQAEYVRIPHADTSLHLVPTGTDEDALVMLSDILPTGHEIGVLYGHVKPGDTIAIVGAGPIGMSVLLTSKFYSPAKVYMIDLDDNRLRMAQKLGATDIINPGSEDAISKILAETIDGVDVAVEAVGIEKTFNLCQSILCPGGNLAVVGVFGHSVELRLQELWIRNITLTTGLVNTNTIPMLIKTVSSGIIDPLELVSHHFRLDEILRAYEVFENASVEKAMKVIIQP